MDGIQQFGHGHKPSYGNGFDQLPAENTIWNDHQIKIFCEKVLELNKKTYICDKIEIQFIIGKKWTFNGYC